MPPEAFSDSVGCCCSPPPRRPGTDDLINVVDKSLGY
jgi:hypothetical protein